MLKEWKEFCNCNNTNNFCFQSYILYTFFCQKMSEVSMLKKMNDAEKHSNILEFIEHFFFDVEVKESNSEIVNQRHLAIVTEELLNLNLLHFYKENKTFADLI